MRTSATQSSSGSSPRISRDSPRVTGASTPARVSAWASSGTPSIASTAWPMRSGISAAGTPSASSSPARRLRDCGASAVATRSPVPASPMSDSGRAPRPSPKRQTSAKMWPAAAPAALRPWRSVAPAASAAAFLAAPASSTPTGSLDASQTTPAFWKNDASAQRERLVGRRGDQAGALVDHLARVRGPADAADALGAELGGSRSVGGVPSGGTRPLASETIAARLGRPGGGQAGDDRVQAARRDGEQDVVRARQARADRLDPQVAGA